jgi:hypothetical protein
LEVVAPTRLPNENAAAGLCICSLTMPMETDEVLCGNTPARGPDMVEVRVREAEEARNEALTDDLRADRPELCNDTEVCAEARADGVDEVDELAEAGTGASRCGMPLDTPPRGSVAGIDGAAGVCGIDSTELMAGHALASAGAVSVDRAADETATPTPSPPAPGRALSATAVSPRALWVVVVAESSRVLVWASGPRLSVADAVALRPADLAESCAASLGLGLDVTLTGSVSGGAAVQARCVTGGEGGAGRTRRGGAGKVHSCALDELAAIVT